MTHLENTNINEPISNKLRKKDAYETDFQNIYNLIVGQTNIKLREKAENKATLQMIKIG